MWLWPSVGQDSRKDRETKLPFFLMIIFHILPMAFRGGWNRFRCKGAIINLESEEKEMREEKKMKITKELKEG